MGKQNKGKNATKAAPVSVAAPVAKANLKSKKAAKRGGVPVAPVVAPVPKVQPIVATKKLNKNAVKQAIKEIPSNLVKPVKGKKKAAPVVQVIEESDESDDDEEDEDESIEQMVVESDEEEDSTIADEEEDSTIADEDDEDDDDVEEQPIGKAPESDEEDEEKVETAAPSSAVLDDDEIEEENGELTIDDLPNTLFVGNCHVTTKRAELTEIFKQYGSIKSIYYAFFLFEGRKVGLKAYIVYENSESVTKAAEHNNHELRGHQIYVGKVQWTSLEYFADHIIFVGNLPISITNEQLGEFFSDCGEVALIEILTKSANKKQAFVFFRSTDSVQAAVKLNESVLDGNQLLINKRQSKENLVQLRVFVKNLSAGVTKKNIEKFFAECGEICTVEFASHGSTAIVNFRSNKSIKKALELSGSRMEGFESSVFVEPTTMKDYNKYTISIYNLSENTTQATLFKHFSKCGNVVYCNIYKSDRPDKRPSAVVRFQQYDSVERATKMNNSTIDGNLISVRRLKPYITQRGNQNPRFNGNPRFNRNPRFNGNKGGDGSSGLTPFEKQMLIQINKKLMNAEN